ncbi:GNAT family N-acetyltransferase [Cupriavidus sp. AU9028]|uniref:GNAT family N-acetyltransferase n=1 Tax=Cupriavidus sp. AU9028 TaxID=2871157 RepID=UPI001C93EDCE|nr:GNAT family N-acetyltransferase [Cupriavidus sp. AU9028]MBY4896708.1 GNAT family N-acetyltransferase [Cupriavidus sp. AU9028]
MPIMRGDGFSLRPFRQADAEQFATAVRESMSTLGRWMPWASPRYSVRDAQLWFELCTENMASGLAYDIGVFSEDGRQLYGGVALNQLMPECNMANLGYWIRQGRQGKGLATRAAVMMACFGFHRLRLTRIEIVADRDNVASRRVAEKTGAMLECIARNRLVLNGVPRPAAIYSLVPESFHPDSERGVQG